MIVGEDPFLYNRLVRVSTALYKWSLTEDAKGIIKILSDSMSFEFKCNVANSSYKGSVWLHRSYVENVYNLKRYYSASSIPIIGTLCMYPKKEWQKYLFRVQKPNLILVCEITGDKRLEYRDEDFLLHREDGPALVCNDFKIWLKHGCYDRDDGPAIEGRIYNLIRWFYCSKWNIFNITEAEQIKYENYHKWDSLRIVNMWYKMNKLHRDDGPAVIQLDDKGSPTGYQEWWLKGKHKHKR